jgi:hypothetical protein
MGKYFILENLDWEEWDKEEVASSTTALLFQL